MGTKSTNTNWKEHKRFSKNSHVQWCSLMTREASPLILLFSHVTNTDDESSRQFNQSDSKSNNVKMQECQNPLAFSKINVHPVCRCEFRRGTCTWIKYAFDLEMNSTFKVDMSISFIQSLILLTKSALVLNGLKMSIWIASSLDSNCSDASVFIRSSFLSLR